MRNTGPIGPVAVSVALLLLFVAPLMRGGNRQVALIALEAIALAFMLSVLVRVVFSVPQQFAHRPAISPASLLIAFLLLSPAWLALVYLLPVPAGFWSTTPGREIYLGLLPAAGVTPPAFLPLSLVPDATLRSLLAGLPLVAGFLIGYLARGAQLKLLFGLVVAIAFAQTVMGLLQMAGGAQSALYFGGDGGRPFGTFANPNHFANYLAMALALYVYLAWDNLQSSVHHGHGRAAEFAARHRAGLWISGGLLLLVGILISRSRGAALTGLPAAMLAVALVLFSSRRVGWRAALLMLGGGLAAAVVLVGPEVLVSRFNPSGITGAASIRGLLTATTLEGAREFWPWGAGWGSYAAVYPRFEPMGSDGVADYAHHDYAQMLFEGGVFAVAMAAAFLWLAAHRAVLLIRFAVRHRALDGQRMLCAMCGLGLLGLMLHSLVDFNMHIPANAILGALLAGAYLRPLHTKDATA